MHQRFKSWSSVFLLGLGLTFSNSQMTVGDDWPTFRGPNRTAVVNDPKLLKSWPAEGPKLLWETSGAGRGYASLAIVGDKMFTLGDGLSTQKDADEYLSCFDRATGKQLWATKTGTPWTDHKDDSWNSSRGTPTVDDGRVYIVTPSGLLICCQAADGKEIWKKHLKNDFGGKKADSWGYSESVLVDGNKILCTPGGSSSTVVALDKKTGETLWTCKNPDDRGAGHSSIVISKVGNMKVYVQSTGSGLMGFSETGSLQWTYPASATAVIPTPIIRNDLIFYPVGYKKGGALVQQVPSSDGSVTLKEIYPFNVKLANKHGGVVLVGDHVYGDSDSDGAPFCADLMTGEERWKRSKGTGAGSGSAVVIAGGDQLYIRYANGVMALVEANPKEYKEVGSFKIPDSGKRPSWSHPVILDGKLYVRENDKVLCYDIRAS